MRIALIGQAAFGEKVLAALLEAGEELALVFCPPDPPERPSGLRRLAEAHRIPLVQPRKMRDPEVSEAYARYQPDLNVMAFVTDIVPQRILDAPRLGSIQYHPSLLPRHRGGSAINWAVIQGETVTGLSIFWPDKGIDTGPVLLQKEAVIDPDDTTGSLYFNKLFPLGVQALVEAVQLVREGQALRLAQDESQATYEPLCTEERTAIDWSRPMGEVYNLVRGANPQPGAHARLNGARVKFFDCRKLDRAHECPPGEVLEAGPDGLLVAGLGGALLVQRLQPDGEAKQPAADFAAAGRIRPGDRFA
ncbi:MAG: methionyl-tRNA formyltransferase [Chloroflexota bacterium]